MNRWKKFTFAVCLMAAVSAGAVPADIQAETTVSRQGFYDELQPVREIKLGDITVYAFDESPLTLESTIFPDIEAYPDRLALMPGGAWRTITRTYLVRTGDKRVLIDSGWGTERGIDGQTVRCLERSGVMPDEITDILLTHMDVDHISGLIKDGKAVYPSAVLHVARKEYNRWIMDGADREAEYISIAREVANAYAGRIALFDYGDETAPGITARDANGHTAGHTCYEIASGGAVLVVVGDMIHVGPVQMRYASYSSLYDVDPVMAAQTRERILDALSKTDYLVAGMHFPQIGVVRKRADGGYVVVPKQ